MKAPIQKLLDIKNKGCKCYLGNKEQKSMLLVVSRLEMQFNFKHPFFCVPRKHGV